MAPPGLATAAVSPPRGSRSSARRCRASTSTGSDAEGAGEARRAFTPAVSLIVALDVALGLLLEDGLENAFERHVRLGRACRAGIKAMGLELFSPDEDRAAVVTAARMPDGIESRELTLALRDRTASRSPAARAS